MIEQWLRRDNFAVTVVADDRPRLPD